MPHDAIMRLIFARGIRVDPECTHQNMDFLEI